MRPWRRYTSLSNGQVAFFSAHRTMNEDRSEIWTVTVAVADHPKQARMAFGPEGMERYRKGRSLCQSTTGRCGLEGLVALKVSFLEFVQWVKQREKEYVWVDVYPYDIRRKRLYKRFLTPLGFEWSREAWLDEPGDSEDQLNCNGRFSNCFPARKGESLDD